MGFTWTGALILIACSMPAWADLVETVVRVKPSVVAIGSYLPTRSPPHIYQGTGFVVADGLTVVTNAHVVPRTLDSARKEELLVLAQIDGQAQRRKAHIAMVDLEHDLLLLRITGAPLPPLTLGDAERVKEGMPIAFTGFPLGMALGMRPVTHRGIVSAVTQVATRAPDARQLEGKSIERLRRQFLIFQLDATAYPGNSGSPMYDPDTGVVYGVLNSVFVKSTKESGIREPSGISYVIPVNFVHDLLRVMDDQSAKSP